jgi:mono/diheme cytochrome c family protein
MYHGGGQPLDIYRRIYSGINGTPMPAFSTKLSGEPETFWHLVHYVQSISGARRAEVVAAESKRHHLPTAAPAQSETP